MIIERNKMISNKKGISSIGIKKKIKITNFNAKLEP